MRRRDFIGMAAALPATAIVPMSAASTRSASSGRTRRVDVEMVYKSPHRQPNGLQATPEGLWVLDQQPENFVSLVNYADGKVIREFQVEGLDGAGGVTINGNDMWINDTHNNTIVRVDQRNGTILAKYWNHGQGPGYRMPGDPPQFRSPLPPAYPPPERAAGAGGGGGGGGGAAGGAPLPYGQMPIAQENGLRGNSGAGIEYRDGRLYHASMYNRRAWVINPETWEVDAVWNLPGNRGHGMGWDPSGDGLWIADTNLMAFFRHDHRTGAIVETIQLTAQDAAIHGATVHDGYMWYCDDVGYICNFKLG
jgi:hypothetical protein